MPGLVRLDPDEQLSLDSGDPTGRKLKILPTKKGLARQSRDLEAPSNEDMLLVELQPTEVELISTNLVEGEVSAYCVVKGTYERRWNDLGSKIYSTLPPPEKKKFIALFEFDEFEGAWQRRTWVEALLHEELRADPIEKMLDKELAGG